MTEYKASGLTNASFSVLRELDDALRDLVLANAAQLVLGAADISAGAEAFDAPGTAAQRRKYPGFLEDSSGSALAGAVAAAELGSARR